MSFNINDPCPYANLTLSFGYYLYIDQSQQTNDKQP